MKITVFGATGGTGQQLLDQACAAGHEVTAVVRDPSRLTHPHPQLTVVSADVMDPAAIGPAIAGREAVVSTIGSRDRRAPSTVCADSAVSIIQAMKAQGVRRLVVVSASGMHIDDGDGPLTRLVAKPILRTVLKHPFADMRRMEDLVRASGLEWTILCPPMLTDGPRTGTYRSAVDHNVRGGIRVSRADLADSILRCLADNAALTAAISIGN
jgi:putative NADH-flavin reductase